MPESRSIVLQACLDRLRDGELAARDELLQAAQERFLALTRTMLRGYQRLRRWEQTDDVLQGAQLRLHRALATVAPPTVRDFYRLATAQIRRELIDLSRHYYGPLGLGQRHETLDSNRDDVVTPLDPGNASLEPAKLADWTEFHQQVDTLPDDEREVFELLWYQELTQDEAAGLLHVSSRTVLRRWQAARMKMHRYLVAEPT